MSSLWKAFWLRFCGALVIALAVFSMIFEVLSKGEHSYMPWPVAIVVLAVGVILVRRARAIDNDRLAREDRLVGTHHEGDSKHA